MIKTNWDLSQIYKAEEEFESDYELAQKLCTELEKFRGKLSLADKSILIKYFKTDDRFSEILEKLAVFVHCKNDDDGKDDKNVRNYMMINDFYSKVSEKLSFVKSELALLEEDFLTDLLNDKNFEDYSRVIEYLLRTKLHTPSENDEKMLAIVSGFSNTDDIYSVISDIEMHHGEVESVNGEKITLTTGNYNKLLKDNNQNFRKKVMETYLGEYKRFNQTFAQLYISHIKYMGFVAKARKFDSVLDMETYGEQVDKDIMVKNIKYVSENVSLLQKYFSLKREILGLKDFYSSDISADFSFGSKNISFEEATKDIKNAFEPLGVDYQDAFENALANGWIDALPRENKASGGYTISTYLIHPYILLNFDGTEYWKSAIAHEFGHAMHSFYSQKNQPFAKYDYTIFVAEVASLTNEILLSKYMLEHEQNKEMKMQILSDFLALFYLNVFNSSMLAEFELLVHNRVWNGDVVTAEDLNSEFVNLCKKYFGKDVVLTENYEADWERKSHIFRDYYLYKYSTGLISACAIASRILEDKSGEYVKKYKKFLTLGNSIPPVESLLVADIDISKKETYDFAFRMFGDYLDKLKKLYEEK